MELENENLYKTINFRLLDDKYLKIFDETQLNIISTFPIEQSKFLTFNDDQLTMVKTIMDKNKDSDDFREILSGLLYNMDGYEKLCSNINIEQLEQKDIEKMVSLLQYKNFLNIETEEQIRDFDNVKRERLEQIMEDKESSTTQKMEAVIWKKWGMDYETAVKFIQEFPYNAEDNNKMKLLSCLVQMSFDIERLDDKSTGTYWKYKEKVDAVLERIFYTDEIEDVLICDKIALRHQYKETYEENINSNLFKVNEDTPFTIQDGVKLYQAGTDFNILMSALGAYKREENRENLKEDWNRKDFSTEHFCGSMIRNDMLGCCETDTNVYYGFSNIKEGSLLYMAYGDVGSGDNQLSTTIQNTYPFQNNDEFINATGKGNKRGCYYNEVDIKRRIKGERIQPDYIIVFKNNGQYVNLENSIQASKEWDGLPIVVIDIDQCLENEYNNINNMTQEYELNPSREQIIKIWNIFHNISNTILRWRTDEIDKLTERVQLPKELQENIFLGKNRGYPCFWLKNEDYDTDGKVLFNGRKKLELDDELIEDIEDILDTMSERDSSKDEEVDERVEENNEEKAEIQPYGEEQQIYTGEELNKEDDDKKDNLGKVGENKTIGLSDLKGIIKNVTAKQRYNIVKITKNILSKIRQNTRKGSKNDR